MNASKHVLARLLAVPAFAAAAALACPAIAADMPNDGATRDRAPIASQHRSPRPSLESASITRRHTDIDDSGLYRRELQACRTGRTQQDTATCLEEARNAHAARQQGRLVTTRHDYLANALARCRPLAGENRAACEARVMGFGGTSGSVAGGGILRWVETVAVPPGQDHVRFFPRTSEPVVVLRTP